MSSPSVRATILAAALALVLGVAWVLPPLAILLVWPLLTLLPGLAVLALLRPRLDTAGRIGVAIVASVAISTHLVYWLSLAAGGYGRGVVFAAAALLGVPLPLLAWRGRGLGAARVRGPVRPALIVAALAATVVGGTLAAGMWRTTATGISSGGSNWSDLGVHLSIAQTVNAGAPFPPDVPYFAGVPLVYHWFADFHAAILAEAAGIFAVPAMVFQSALLAASLALVTWSLARHLVRRAGARRVATIAAVLVVFGGGVGYVRFIGDISAGLGSPLELIAKNSYDNQWLTGWPYFRVPSVMGTGLLAHRATTAGLPILVAAILLLVVGLPSARHRLRGWRDRPEVIALAGLLGALLAPFHFFYFPLVPLLALLWVIASGRLIERSAPRNALAFLGPFVLAVPFVVAPALQASGSGALRLLTLWPSAPIEDGPAGVLFFYLTNLGIPFVLAIFALVSPRVPRGPFLAAWLLACFLIPNVVQVSVVDFDMNKYFQAMWIAAGILAAWLIHRWPMPAIAAVVALSIPSPLLVAGWTATSNLQVISNEEAAASAWVARETPADAIFVTDGWVNSLTDSAGRRRLTTFGPYIANLGYAPDERIADVLAIYCGGDPAASERLMRKYGAAYVIDAARPSPCNAPVDFSTSDAFQLVYDAGIRIWRLP